MANPILTLSNLARTMSTYFRIGTLRINDASAVAEIKDATGAAYGALKATQVRFAGANAAFYTALTSASGLGGSVVFTLPAADGSTGQFLKTDGSTNLGWAAASLYSEQVIDTAFSEASGATLAIFTPPANGTITKVQITVAAAAATGTPTIAVGIVADPDRDMDETETDLKTAGCYEVYPNTAVSGSPAAMIAAVTPTAAETFTGVVRIWYANAE